jgi:hypothetical protein
MMDEFETGEEIQVLSPPLIALLIALMMQVVCPLYRILPR